MTKPSTGFLNEDERKFMYHLVRIRASPRLDSRYPYFCGIKCPHMLEGAGRSCVFESVRREACAEKKKKLTHDELWLEVKDKKNQDCCEEVENIMMNLYSSGTGEKYKFPKRLKETRW